MTEVQTFPYYVLWQQSLESRLQQMGQRRAPWVSTQNIPLPAMINRHTGVLQLSMFYQQNLLNSFLHLAQRKKCVSPLCVCQKGEQTLFHLLVECELINSTLRDNLLTLLISGNKWAIYSDRGYVPADYISLLNCSRSYVFIQKCLEVL